MLDPFAALAEFVLGRLKQAMIAQWLRLLFELGFSAAVAFLFICGTALLATGSVTMSTGSGMVAAALCMTYLFRRSPLTKRLMVVLPAAEAVKEAEAQLQTIGRK